MINDTALLKDHDAPNWVLDSMKPDFEAQCWIWTGSRSRRYGSQGGDRAVKQSGIGKGRNVARVMWEEMQGELSSSVVVRHTCDNPMCVRPEHLRTGTYAQNTNDARVRGRLRPGGFPRLI